MIEVRQVSKRYGRRPALSDVSLTFVPGEVTLLLGSNGAGKSTLLRAILGIEEHEGAIRIDGVDPLTAGGDVRARIGYMPQSGGLHPELTVDETLALYADIRRVPRERCAVLRREAGLEGSAGVRVGDLSGGMRQRLGFAVALLTDPCILVLDEPGASLDRASRQWLARRLRAAADDGRLVLVSTHGGEELLRAGDRQIVLEDGRVIADERTSGRGLAADSPSWETTRVGASLLPLVRKELKDAVRSRWLIGYAIVLGGLGLAAASAGTGEASALALQAYGRTTATLMNLCLLLAPLVAVLMGASTIAAERDRGTLEHLLAQPISRGGLLLAKHAALLLSLVAATIAGFLPAGAVIAGAAGPQVLPHYLIFPGIAATAGAAMAGIGVLISVSSRTSVQAQGAAVFVWFAFVLLYDLVLIGSLATTGVSVELIAGALLANPVDAARVLGVLSLEPDLYLLGPAGAWLTSQFSRGGTALLLTLALAFWAVAPVAGALLRFSVSPGWRRRLTARERTDEKPGTPALAASPWRRFPSPVRSAHVTDHT